MELELKLESLAQIPSPILPSHSSTTATRQKLKAIKYVLKNVELPKLNQTLKSNPNHIDYIIIDFRKGLVTDHWRNTNNY